MLFLPRAVQIWVMQKAIEKDTSTGSFMIDIVTRYAWENGFVCSHGPVKKFDKQNLVKTITENEFLMRCRDCGLTVRVKEKKGGVCEVIL